MQRARLMTCNVQGSKRCNAPREAVLLGALALPCHQAAFRAFPRGLGVGASRPGRDAAALAVRGPQRALPGPGPPRGSLLSLCIAEWGFRPAPRSGFTVYYCCQLMDFAT